jgi:hypothetical protein
MSASSPVFHLLRWHRGKGGVLVDACTMSAAALFTIDEGSK